MEPFNGPLETLETLQGPYKPQITFATLNVPAVQEPFQLDPIKEHHEPLEEPLQFYYAPLAP